MTSIKIAEILDPEKLLLTFAVTDPRFRLLVFLEASGMCFLPRQPPPPPPPKQKEM